MGLRLPIVKRLFGFKGSPPTLGYYGMPSLQNLFGLFPPPCPTLAWIWSPCPIILILLILFPRLPWLHSRLAVGDSEKYQSQSPEIVIELFSGEARAKF